MKARLWWYLDPPSPHQQEKKSKFYLLILPTPSRAFWQGDWASGRNEKGKGKRMTVRLYTDDRLKTRSKIEGENKNNSLGLISI